MIFRISAVLTVLALLMAGGASAASVVTGPEAPPMAPALAQSGIALPSPSSEEHALTAQDAESFFDGLVPYALSRGDIAGGVVVIVKDGKVLFEKGYGYADVAAHAPVIPDRTLFRPGSVSKLFTWTAVMQLVQAGKLDLDRDVNDYLDFRIPPKFGKPITLRNLMTHTPGFEEGIHDSFVKTPGELIPLRDYMMKRMPARIYPPGKVVAYSNYGASLSGYIVQRVSGELFADYIAHHIFQPLRMMHSTFVQPLPAALVPSMAKGYVAASDKKPAPFELVETAPAGALSATGDDMAHFMIAHLENGTYNGAAILSPATVKLMHSPQSRMAPGVNGFDLGFYQENRNGLRIIGHAGDTEAFHSDLHLLADKDVGIFMSFNSAGKEGAAEGVRVGIFRAFLDRYFPYVPPVEKTIADPGPDAARVAGWYESSRRITSALRLLSAAGQAQVAAEPDGTVEISVLKDNAGTTKKWREVGPLIYREVGGQTHTKFVTDANGNVRYWVSDDFIPVMVFQKLHGLKQMSSMLFGMGLLVVSIVFTLAIWFGGWIVRRRFDRPLDLSARAAALRLASRIGVVLVLAMLLGWMGLVASLASGNAKLDGLLSALYVLGVLAAIGAIAIVVEAALRVLRGPGGWLVRLGEFVLGLSGLYALWAIYVYGLANFSFTY